MSTWVGMGPMIGPGSLDGFAIGVMMSGAVFLAVTAPRRARRRPVVAGSAGTLTAGPRTWLSRHPRLPRISRAPRVSEIPRLSGGSGIPELSEARAFDGDAFEPGAFEAGAFGPSPFGAGPFAAGAERLVRPDEPRAYSDAGWLASVGDDGRAAGGHRNRHRLNEPLPGLTSPDRAPRGGTSRDSGPRGGAPRSGGFPDSAFPDSAFPDSAFPDSAFPDSAFPESRFPESGFPDVAFPDEARWRNGPSPDGPRPDAGRPWALPGDGPHEGSPLEPLPDMAPRDELRREPRDARWPEPRDGRRLEPPFPDWASREEEQFPNRGEPDVEFPDVAFPDGTFGTSKRQEPRRFPRHAAPAVGLAGKVGQWMTGLFAGGEAGMGRWAGSGARG